MKSIVHINPISKLQQDNIFNGYFENPIDIIQTSKLDEVQQCLDKVWEYSYHNKYAVGFVSFECAKAFDINLSVKNPQMPLLYFAIYDNYTFKDIEYSNKEIQFTAKIDEQNYFKSLDYIKNLIVNGDVYQINFTNILKQNIKLDKDIYYHLFQHQPHAYSFFLEYGKEKILSFSPELFFHTKDNSILTQPMKGTHKRSQNILEDECFKNYLQSNEKEKAENIMIVDLLRNDLAKICSNIETTNIFECIKLPTVWQMVSSIQGDLKKNIRLFDIFKALFPCGSITGAPKIESMKVINKLEQSARNIYCGTIGLIKPYGECIFNVAIRTLYTQDRSACYGVGSGITIDSINNNELLELYAKMAFLNK